MAFVTCSNLSQYIRMADSFVEVPGGSNNNNYVSARPVQEARYSSQVEGCLVNWTKTTEARFQADDATRPTSISLSMSLNAPALTPCGLDGEQVPVEEGDRETHKTLEGGTNFSCKVERSGAQSYPR